MHLTPLPALRHCRKVQKGGKFLFAAILSIKVLWPACNNIKIKSLPQVQKVSDAVAANAVHSKIWTVRELLQSWRCWSLLQSYSMALTEVTAPWTALADCLCTTSIYPDLQPERSLWALLVWSKTQEESMKGNHTSAGTDGDMFPPTFSLSSSLPICFWHSHGHSC